MRQTTILLIDDSASTREELRVALESEGYSVLEAADGRDGVRLYREHRPAIVLVDIVMPEKDGIVRRVRVDDRCELRALANLTVADLDGIQSVVGYLGPRCS